MNAAYRITECLVETALPQKAGYGRCEEFVQFQDDAYFDANKVGFEILDDEGRTMAKGYFVGDDSGRDWPLVSARYFNKAPPKPKRIEYDDGRKWVYRDDWECGVEATTAAQ